MSLVRPFPGEHYRSVQPVTLDSSEFHRVCPRLIDLHAPGRPVPRATPSLGKLQGPVVQHKKRKVTYPPEKSAAKGTRILSKRLTNLPRLKPGRWSGGDGVKSALPPERQKSLSNHMYNFLQLGEQSHDPGRHTDCSWHSRCWLPCRIRWQGHRSDCRSAPDAYPIEEVRPSQPVARYAGCTPVAGRSRASGCWHTGRRPNVQTVPVCADSRTRGRQGAKSCTGRRRDNRPAARPV